MGGVSPRFWCSNPTSRVFIHEQDVGEQQPATLVAGGPAVGAAADIEAAADIDAVAVGTTTSTPVE